jgi:alpha-beta hydrolase superfamily lysophospholipase
MPIIKHLFLALGYGLIGVFTTIVFVYTMYLQNRPDLEAWHTIDLEEEFTASKAESIQSFNKYLDLENRLFTELREKVYQGKSNVRKNSLNRYFPGSMSDPMKIKQNWNRSFEINLKNPRGGVLLIHGLSDSPYSMRALAKLFQRQGYYVLGLRLPGHGTVPAGLLGASWQDFTAATRLAAKHVRHEIGDNKPFYIAGYSTGAALAVEYSLAILEGENLPAADGLVLISPAIGVNPIAMLAKYQAHLAALPGLEKFAWDSIQPEFNPYKYQSFAVNAGDQIYRLTRQIEQRINHLDKGQGVVGMPTVLAFQSVVDATVSTRALVKVLFKRLAAEGHELVLFDIDRSAHIEPFISVDPLNDIKNLFAESVLPFTTTLLTNISPETQEIYAQHRLAGLAKVTGTRTGLTWPDGIYSLAHTALPFSPNDPVYGSHAPKEKRLVYLGKIDLRGERGLFIVPASELLRLSYNPFYSYIEDRIIIFLNEKQQVN